MKMDMDFMTMWYAAQDLCQVYGGRFYGLDYLHLYLWITCKHLCLLIRTNVHYLVFHLTLADAIVCFVTMPMETIWRYLEEVPSEHTISGCTWYDMIWYVGEAVQFLAGNWYIIYDVYMMMVMSRLTVASFQPLGRLAVMLQYFWYIGCS